MILFISFALAFFSAFFVTTPQKPSQTPDTLPVIAIVGRPNVGKSTLFNRLAGRRVAIVMDTPGVTRDRHYRDITWNRLRFTLIDTGGVDPEQSDPLKQDVGAQSLATLEQADIVLFMTDARDGLTPADQELANIIRKSKPPVIHLVNKADSDTLEQEAFSASALGFDPVIPISAEHSRGLDLLYDELEFRLPKAAPLPDADEAGENAGEPMVRVAVVGRPNVGKSTLINRLLGEDRLVVSDIPGTTRDAIDSEVSFGDTRYLFIDTAGIRRRGRIDKGIERASVSRTMSALKRAEVAVLLMDATEGVTDLDTKIAGQIIQARRGCILGINKWDTKKGDAEALTAITSEMERLFPFLAHAPVVRISGLSGHNMGQLFTAINRVAVSFRRRIPTGEMNRAVEYLVSRQEPPRLKGRRVRIYYATQVKAAPPRIVLFSNQPDGLTGPYQRYLENGLRTAFDFTGTPLKFDVRHRDKDKRSR